jgi:hypothetical protein
MIINEHIRQKQKSLSERLSVTARNEGTYQSHSNKQILCENLQYNLALTIAQIIYKLKVKERSLALFERILKEFNEKNQTTLSLTDFTEMGWLRLIYYQIVIPTKVRGFLRKLKGNAGDILNSIPAEDRHKIQCLLTFDQQISEAPDKTISFADLQDIIDRYSPKGFNSAFIVDKEILRRTAEPNVLVWNEQSDYSRYLRNEIAACLWLQHLTTPITAESFSLFIHQLFHAAIWPDNITAFLTAHDCEVLSKHAADVLTTESDLDFSDSEVIKVWMDSRFDKNYNLYENAPPMVHLNKDSSYDLIKQLEFSESAYQEILYHQPSRSIYHLLLSLIFQISFHSVHPYQILLSIFKNAKRPYLVWMIFNDSAQLNPGTVPFLLAEFELAPIAYLLVDKLKPNAFAIDSNAEFEFKNSQSYQWANELWLELFELTMDLSINHRSIESTKSLFNILEDLSGALFSYSRQDRYSPIKHNLNLKRFSHALDRLSEKRETPAYSRLASGLYPRFISSIICDLLKNSTELPKKLPRNEFLDLNLAHFHITIELLKLADREVAAQTAIPAQIKAAVDYLKLLLEEFYQAVEIKYEEHFSGEIIHSKPKRGLNNFGLETVDWGYLFLKFQQYDYIKQIDSLFTNHTRFNTTNEQGIYDPDNLEEAEKIYHYLKILLKAYLGVQSKKLVYEFEGLPVTQTLANLEYISKHLSLKYSVDKIKDSRIDVFNERFHQYSQDFLHETLSSLLFKSLNYQEERKSLSFVGQFFKDSIDLSRMLLAINTIESNLVTDSIATLVQNIPVEKFIGSALTVTELQKTLVEATNAEANWTHLTEELVRRIKEHYKARNYSDQYAEEVMYQVALISAFKQKKLTDLESVVAPKYAGIDRGNDFFNENLKKYYIAIFKLFHLERFDEAILELTELIKLDSGNILYHLNLYKAKTAKAIKTDDSSLLINGAAEWERYYQTIASSKSKELEPFLDEINITQLYLHIHNRDFSSFDLAISRLPNRYLYHEEILAPTFNFYLSRNLYDLASEYLLRAKTYYQKNHIPRPGSLSGLLESYPDEKMIQNLKQTLSGLTSQRAVDIPRILPNFINGKQKIKEFILAEFVQASKVMTEKIEAIRHIQGENRFNDMIYAILTLRMPLWGWSLQDQSRVGQSPSGKDAGEADFIIQAGGTTIALCEAFILGTKGSTTAHLLKCRKYNDSLDCYYILVYSTGDASDFEKKWLNYQSHVSTSAYPKDFQYDSAIGFVDLSGEFTNAANMKIAKSSHQKYELYHIMLNIGNY